MTDRVYVDPNLKSQEKPAPVRTVYPQGLQYCGGCGKRTVMRRGKCGHCQEPQPGINIPGHDADQVKSI